MQLTICKVIGTNTREVKDLSKFHDFTVK